MCFKLSEKSFILLLTLNKFHFITLFHNNRSKLYYNKKGYGYPSYSLTSRKNNNYSIYLNNYNENFQFQDIYFHKNTMNSSEVQEDIEIIN